MISRNPHNASNRRVSYPYHIAGRLLNSQTKGVAFRQFVIPHRRAVKKSWGFSSDTRVSPSPQLKAHILVWIIIAPIRRVLDFDSFIIVNSDITNHDGLTRDCSYWWLQNPRAPATRRGGKSRWRGLALGKENTSTCGSRSRYAKNHLQCSWTQSHP